VKHQRVFWQAVLCLAALGPVTAAAQIERQLETPDGIRMSWMAPPYWDHSGLLVFHQQKPQPGEPDIVVVNRDGKMISSFQLEVPDASVLRIRDAVALDAGKALVSLTTTDPVDRAAALLCLVDASGKATRVIRTNPFVAHRVRVAPDGSIWGFGAETKRRPDGSSAEVFRRYSPTGVLLGAYLPVSTFQMIGEKFHPSATSGRYGVPFLLSSADRIGAYAPSAGEWIEFQPDGKLIGRWKTSIPAASARGSHIQSIAMTASNRVFALLAGEGRLCELDRKAAAWVPLPADALPAEYQNLGGAEGDSLIVHRPTSSSGRAYAWIPAP
jgi:hypothetical protein